MNNQKASSSNSNKEADVARMPAWLFRAAIIGDKQVLDSVKEETVDDHREVSIEVFGSAPNPRAKKLSMVSQAFSNFFKKKKKLSMEYLRSTTYMGNTVLHILAASGHAKLAYTICQKDRSMWRAQNKMLETPIHCAAKAGHYEVISKLIKFGRTVNDKNNNLTENDELKSVLREQNKCGETALHEAARRGYGSVITMLMEVDPTLACQCNDDGVSPLYLAAARVNNKDDNTVVDNMLKQLSDYYICHTDGRIRKASSHLGPPENAEVISPLYSAAPRASPDDHHTIIKKMPELLSKHNTDGVSSDGPSKKTASDAPLKSIETADISKTESIHFLASTTGRHSVVKLLLAKDPSLAYHPDSDGLFPIHVAAQAGNVTMFALFMEMFPDSSELLDNRGRNFFHIAAQEGMLDVFAKIMYKAEGYPMSKMNQMLTRMINETDNEGNTPLHLAAERGCKSAMETILLGRIGLTSFRELMSGLLAMKKIRPHRNLYVSILYLLGAKKKYILDRNQFEIAVRASANTNIDMHIRNRKGFTPFDISVIQLKENATNFLATKERIGHYTREQGDRFTPQWFNGVMQIGEGSNPTNIMSKLQLIGLGAVLITTVAFAVAFTLPGGFGSNGLPVLGRKYFFKAFILANTLAFIVSALCLAMIIYNGLTSKESTTRDAIEVPLLLLSTGVKCMVLAFGLGLYLMVAPVDKAIGILILIMIFLVVMLEIVIIMSPSDNYIKANIARGGKSFWTTDDFPFRVFAYMVLYLVAPFIFLFALLK